MPCVVHPELLTALARVRVLSTEIQAGKESTLKPISCHLVIGAVLSCILIGCQSKTKMERAGDVFIQATQAAAEGRTDEAIELFGKSLDIEPKPYTYLERARLYVKKENIEAAIADCQAGLQLDANHRDLKWLLGECQKPPQQRFQGKNAVSPSRGK